jgi:hypothetical protein
VSRAESTPTTGLMPSQSPLKVSLYDRVSSLLIAMLFLVGLTATTLFLIWLTTVIVFRRVSLPVQMIEYPGRGDHAEGFERDPEPPGLEEVEIEMDEPLLEAALEPVTDVASTVAAAYDTLDTDSVMTTKGTGRGDSRPPGPEGEGQNVIPPWERWEIRYSSNDIGEYARQLDHFGIELGVIGGSKQVDYAYNLARNPPATRQGSTRDEKRIYMMWRTGQLRDFDMQLLNRAGISMSANRVPMQFIPEEINQQLHALEFDTAEGHPPEEWLRTVFGVRASGSGYEYYIIERSYRPSPL